MDVLACLPTVIQVVVICDRYTTGRVEDMTEDLKFDLRVAKCEFLEITLPELYFQNTVWGL